MRLSSVKGTAIGPATDFVATGDGIYDPDGNWKPLGDTHFVQLFASADKEVIAYIKQSTDVYSWVPEAEYGYSLPPKTDWSNVPPVGSDSRDRLTGYVLDENGGYRVPVTVEGVSFSPRYLPCGNAECLTSGANIDFSDANTLRWIKSANAQAIDGVGRALGVGAVFASGGTLTALSNSSMAAGLLSGYLKDDFAGATTQATLSAGFVEYATHRGLAAEVAGRISNGFSAAGVWGTIVENGRDFLKDE